MDDVIVGTPVHYYTKNPEEQSNGQGMGPYYGVVVQTFPGSSYANLQIFAPFKSYYAGSVQHRDDAFAEMMGAELPARWFEPMALEKFITIDDAALKAVAERADAHLADGHDDDED